MQGLKNLKEIFGNHANLFMDDLKGLKVVDAQRQFDDATKAVDNLKDQAIINRRHLRDGDPENAQFYRDSINEAVDGLPKANSLLSERGRALAAAKNKTYGARAIAGGTATGAVGLAGTIGGKDEEMIMPQNGQEELQFRETHGFPSSQANPLSLVMTTEPGFIRDQMINKTASTAWRRNFHLLSDAAKERVKDVAGVTQDRWQRGLDRGNEALIKKHDIMLNPNREEFTNQWNSMLKANPSASKEIENMIGSDMLYDMATQTPAMSLNTRGFKKGVLLEDTYLNMPDNVKNTIYDKPGIFKGVAKMLADANMLHGKYLPRITKGDHEFLDTVGRRHEIDEIRLGNKIFNNDDMYRTEYGDAFNPRTLAGHQSPAVIMREGDNLIGANTGTREYITKLRAVQGEQEYLKSGNPLDIPIRDSFDYNNNQKSLPKVERSVSKDIKDFTLGKYDEAELGYERINPSKFKAESLDETKTASTAWRRNFHLLSDAAKERVKDVAGVTQDRWQRGLERGNEALIKRYNIMVNPSQSDLAGLNFRFKMANPSRIVEIEKTFNLDDDYDSLNESAGSAFDFESLRHFYRNGPLEIPDGLKSVIFSKPGDQKKIIDGFYAVDPETKSLLPEVFDADEKFLHSLGRRHEIDEIRLGKKTDIYFDENKDSFNPTQYYSHVSPAVLMRESDNLIGGSPISQKFQKNLRSYTDESLYLMPDEDMVDFQLRRTFDYKNNQKSSRSLENSINKDFHKSQLDMLDGEGRPYTKLQKNPKKQRTSLGETKTASIDKNYLDQLKWEAENLLWDREEDEEYVDETYDSARHDKLLAQFTERAQKHPKFNEAYQQSLKNKEYYQQTTAPEGLSSGIFAAGTLLGAGAMGGYDYLKHPYRGQITRPLGAIGGGVKGALLSAIPAAGLGWGIKERIDQKGREKAGIPQPNYDAETEMMNDLLPRL